MCMGSAPEPPPPPAARQQMKTPQDSTPQGLSETLRNRRGFWASIMTSPQGVTGAPTVTGTPGV